MGTNIYQDLPLLDGLNSMRIARVLPGWPADELQVELSVVPDRSTAPEYDALSYVWGSPSFTNVILCNGTPKTITANLASALRALRPLPAIGDLEQHGVHTMDHNHLLHSARRPWKDFARNRCEAEVIRSRRVRQDADGTEGLVIWIDALCINQANLKECSEQVKGMCGIYRSARRVHIWLGTALAGLGDAPLDLPDMKSSRLDDMLNRISLSDCGHVPVVLSFLAQALRNEDILIDSDGYSGIKSQPFGFPPLIAPEWMILAAFFRNPWFYRVWIVQEVAMAEEAIIIIGDWEVDWEPFTRAVKLFKACSMENSMSIRSLGTWNRLHVWNGIPLGPATVLCHIRQRLARQESHLFDLLLEGHKRKATKQVDHIFAIVGMSEEYRHLHLHSATCGWSEHSMQGLVDIDYTKSPSQVFRDVTTFIFLTQKTLLPLSMVGCADEPDTTNAPSWVPQWTRQPKSPLFWISRDCRQMYNADLGQNMHIQIFHHLNELHVSGYLIDSIEALSIGLKSNTFTFDSLHYPPREEEIDFVTSAWNLIKPVSGTSKIAQIAFKPSYQSSKKVLEAFIYTLSGNKSTADGLRGDADTTVTDSGTAWLEKFIPDFPKVTSSLGKAWHIAKPGHDHCAPGFLFQALIMRVCISRRFFVTFSGFMGIGPPWMREGDKIAVVFGLIMPVVLRRSRVNPGKYNLIGPCYVHGIMDGEAVTAFESRPVHVLHLI